MEDANASSRFNLPSFRVDGPSPDKSDGDGERHRATAQSRAVLVSPARISSIQSYSGPSIDGDMSPPRRSWLAEKGERDHMMPLGGQRHGMVLDRVGAEHGGSRVRSFDGASPHGRSTIDGGVNARTRVSDAHWANDRSHVDLVDEEKKHLGDDPAAVPRHQCVASDTEDRRDRVQGRTGYRQRAWCKLGLFCRERVCKKFFAWRDHIVGGALASVDDGPESAPEPESGPGSGPGQGVGVGVGGLALCRMCAPPVGATGPTTTATIGAGTRSEQSRGRRLSKLMRARPTSTSAWLIGPTSTSTSTQTRSSGRLVKRRPKSLSVAMAGELDKATMSFCA